MELCGAQVGQDPERRCTLPPGHWGEHAVIEELIASMEKNGVMHSNHGVLVREYNGELLKNRQLTVMLHVARGQVEELERHGRDIQTVVTFLHAHMPERFDPSGRQSMGDVMVGICRDYLLLRDKSWLERLWRLLERRAEARRVSKREKLHELDEED